MSGSVTRLDVIGMVVDCCLLVPRPEEEQPVAKNRPADRRAELLRLLVLGLRTVRELRGERLRAVVVEGRAVEVVTAALRDDVHEATAGAPELHRGAVLDDLQFADGFLRQRERGPALGGAVSRGTAEERVVVVDAVERHARVDAALTSELDVPVGGVPLRARREEDEVREVSPVDREAPDRVVVDRGLVGLLCRLDRGELTRDRDVRGAGREAELEVDSGSRTERHDDAGLALVSEARERASRHPVGSDGNAHDAVRAACIGETRSNPACALARRGDRRAGQRLPVGIGDGSHDAPRRDVHLGARHTLQVPRTTLRMETREILTFIGIRRRSDSSYGRADNPPGSNLPG